MRNRLARIGSVLALGALPVVAAGADPLVGAVRIEAVDVAACAVTVADSADAARAPHTTPAEAAYVRAALGLATDGWGWGWPGYRSYRIKPHPSVQQPVVYYRLAFTEPLAVGACAYAARTDNDYGGRIAFFFLKPDAPYPGDPLKPEQWQEVAPAEGQRGPFVTFPPGVRTRALLLRHDAQNASAIERWWIFRQRLFDLRHAAIGQGERCPGAAAASRRNSSQIGRAHV